MPLQGIKGRKADPTLERRRWYHGSGGLPFAMSWRPWRNPIPVGTWISSLEQPDFYDQGHWWPQFA